MILEDALELLDTMSAEDLRSLTRNDLMYIVSGMNEKDRSKFFIEKNIKVFGGINEYIRDFLQKTNINSIKNSSIKLGIHAMLTRISVYPGITDENKSLLQAALEKTMIQSAPAAGGSRRKNTRKIKKNKRTTKRKTKLRN